MQKKDFFDFLIKRVNEVTQVEGIQNFKAFPKWFIKMYFLEPRDIFISDGNADGKIDAFFKTDDGEVVKHHIINSKFTNNYNQIAPAPFYEEIMYFWQAFDNKTDRDSFIEKAVKRELIARYRNLFRCYDAGTAELIFLTNFKKNEPRYELVKKLPIKIFHLDDIIQHLADDLDGAMPRTEDLTLYGINQVLSPDKEDTIVSTSIVFARLIDFIKYMQNDPSDLLFARNIRYDLGNTSVNKEIKETFRSYSEEFAFSSNGITILCEKHRHTPGSKELVIINPRIVNGAQTLHSIRCIPNPSKKARVMVRIIEIPPVTGDDPKQQIRNKKDIINKISIRSNLQNPIKKWNLAAHDDFQLSLSRFFRREKIFYERREKEWNRRSRDLTNVGIKRGPKITKLIQIISCYYFNDKNLGPANARLSVSELFFGNAYEKIKKTSEEVVYNLYLFSQVLEECFLQLPPKKYKKLKPYLFLTTLSYIFYIFKSKDLDWKSAKTTNYFKEKYKENLKDWIQLIKKCVDNIYEHYDQASRAAKKRTGYELSLNNYFKSHTDINRIFSKPIPRFLKPEYRFINKLF